MNAAVLDQVLERTTHRDQRGRDPWSDIHVALVQPNGWSTEELHLGILELERIRRETDAATAVLVNALPVTRDGAAALTRLCGISNREARKRQAVAKVVGALDNAKELLATGAVSTDHLAALAPVADTDGAAELLNTASSMSPEQFSENIEKHRIAALGHTQTAQRQHQRRSVRFFRGADGMVGLSGLLPPLEGQQLKEKLCALVDARWREAHPERAATLGGHGGDTPEQRMADALLEVTGVTGVTAPEWQGESPDSTTIAGARTDDDRNLIASDPSDSPGPGPKGTTSSGTTVRTAKPSVVIVFDIDRYEASILGHGPIPVTASLFDPVKNDLYYHYRNSVGEVLRFGRARKHPSVIQKLAVIVRDRHCQYPGCTAPPEACEIHHFNEWLQDHGLTNVESLGLFCRPHHRHVHVEDLVAIRERDGTVSIRHRRTGSLIARARGVDR